MLALPTVITSPILYTYFREIDNLRDQRDHRDVSLFSRFLKTVKSYFF